MRVSTGFDVTSAAWSRLCLFGLFGLALFFGCQRETGYCETSDQCDGRVCVAETHTCAGDTLGAPLTLTLKTVGSGQVMVDSQTSPCTGSCQFMLAQGAGVRLTAKPAAGFHFAGWSDGCSGGAASCELVMNGALTVTATFTAQICGGATGTNTWCWETPLPQGNTLESVWSFSDVDTWAVGGFGTILHWDGTRFTQSPSNMTNTGLALHSVWGKSSRDVWAVGDGGTILHYDGNAWSSSPSGVTARLNAVWGSSATDVWAVGAVASGLTTILHFTGTAWTAVTAGVNYDLYGLWGSSATDIWAVGDRGLAAHYQTTTWTPIALNGTSQFYAVSGSAANDVWAVGSGGSVYHFNGSAWGPPTAAQSLTAANLRGVAVTAANELSAVGDGGTILRYQGNVWSLARSGGDNGLLGIFAAIGNSATAWTVGLGGAILRRSPGAAWVTAYDTPFVTPYNTFQSVWGSARDDLWVVGDYGVIDHFDGAQFTAVRSSLEDHLLEVWGSGPSDVWAVGSNGAIDHFDGQSWTPMPSSTTQSLYGVWGSGPADVWAVGAAGTVTHFDGRSFTPQAVSSGSNIYGIWGRAANDVWAVGQGGLVYHYNGSAWTFSGAAAVDLYGVFGTNTPNDVWVVGKGGTIMHNENGVFTTKPSPTTAYDLYRISGPTGGASAGSLFIAGFGLAGGILLQGNGATFSPSFYTTSALLAISPVSSANGTNDLFAAGIYGAVLHSSTAPLSD